MKWKLFMDRSEIFALSSLNYSYETNKTLPGKSLERSEKSPKKAF